MATHGLQTALTLYRSGTYSLEQAAAKAGRSEAAFRRVLDQYGIDHPEADRRDPAGATEQPLKAD